MYPTELDLLFAEPMIFEVLKKPNESSSGPVSYEVLRLFTHERLLDVFYGPKNYSPVFIVEVCHSPFHRLHFWCNFICSIWLYFVLLCFLIRTSAFAVLIAI